MPSTLSESQLSNSGFAELATSFDPGLVVDEPEYGVFDADGTEVQPLNFMDHWPEAEAQASDRLMLGNIVVTSGVGGWAQCSADRMDFVLECLGRHRIGDWGEVDDENRSMNDELEATGRPVISCYRVPDELLSGEDGDIYRAWNLLFVMTAAENLRRERPRTTLMWPHEY